MRTNRARQLLALPELFQRHGREPLHVAIDKIVGPEPGATELRDRIYVMLASLPVQVHDQASAVLADRYASYHQEVDRVIGHFRAHSLNSTWDQIGSIYERHVVVSLTAIADLIDAQLSISPVDEPKRAGVEESIRSLISDIQNDDTIDDAVQGYLLGVALHLLQAVQQYVVFGADAVVDMQGRFVTDLFYDHPDLVDAESPAKGYATRLWTCFIAAATVIGVVPDSVELAHLVHQLAP